MNNTKKFLAATIAASALAFGALTGCAVTRDQSTTGEYVDDATITAKVKAQMVESKAVDAAAISVETLKGTVQLSGFAKSSDERAQAEKIAAGVKGVVAVKNSIVVKP